jgi:hypothetical protein
MLQVFYVDVAKVGRDVAYVTMAIHAGCKRLFQLFQLFQTDVARVLHMFHTYVFLTTVFYTYVASVSSRCCICFHIYVASVFI